MCARMAPLSTRDERAHWHDVFVKGFYDIYDDVKVLPLRVTILLLKIIRDSNKDALTIYLTSSCTMFYGLF